MANYLIKEMRAYNKDSFFNKWFGKIGQVHAKKMKPDHQNKPYTRLNSKWITDLSVNCKTTKILEENIGSKTLDTSYRNIFADNIS